MTPSRPWALRRPDTPALLRRARRLVVGGIAVVAAAATIPGPLSSAPFAVDTPPVERTVAPVDLVGGWAGAIELPSGHLVVRVVFEKATVGLRGTIDIPAQGASGLELRGISLEGDGIRFAIAGVPGDPTFDGTIQGDHITGRFSQGGATLDFDLERGADAETKRPQNPERPYPYEEREVTYTNADTALAGTLTLPEGEGPHPAVILLSGSGAQDRNGTVFRHQPFLVLADQFTRRGFAVLRSDDRGVGASGGDLPSSTIEELAGDALAALALLQGVREIDSERIGFLGHSEGGIVAPAAALAAEGGVAFVILLGTPSVPGDEILLRQTELILDANGVAAKDAEAQRELLSRSLELTKARAPEAERRTALQALAERQIESLPTAERRAMGDQLQQIVDAQIEAAMTPWFEYFVRYDPRPALEALEIPVLSMHGGLDLQVQAAQNLPPMRDALSGNPDAEVVVLDGLNHLLQPAKTGSPLEYEVIEQTMSPLALETIYRWLAERFLAVRAPSSVETSLR